MVVYSRILVARGGAIGDFVLTMPVFAALKETYPEASIECLSPSGYGELVESVGLVDAWKNLDDRAWASFFVSNGDLDDEMAKWVSQFDLIVSFLYDPEEAWVNNIRRICSARFIQGCARPSDSGNQPATITLLSVLEEIGIRGADPLPRITIDTNGSDCYDLAVHPGSGSESKNWPIENWIELLSIWLDRNSGNLLVLGGEAEEKKMTQLKEIIDSCRVNFALNRSLVSVASSLSNSRFFLGHDSGITHLAAALGVPALVLWGSSNRCVWSPQHKHVRLMALNEGGIVVSPSTVLDQIG